MVTCLPSITIRVGNQDSKIAKQTPERGEKKYSFEFSFFCSYIRGVKEILHNIDGRLTRCTMKVS